MSRVNVGLVEPCKWLRANGEDLAPLTGQDRSALIAIAHAWELYSRSDARGQRAALFAVASLLDAMQAHCRPITKQLIARAMDWSDIAPLWERVLEMRRRAEEEVAAVKAIRSTIERRAVGPQGVTLTCLSCAPRRILDTQMVVEETVLIDGTCEEMDAFMVRHTGHEVLAEPTHPALNELKARTQ